MATVRITKELRGYIRREVRSLYYDRLNKIRDIHEADNPEQVQALYDLFLGDYADRINALPTGFMRLAKSVTFSSSRETGGAFYDIRVHFDKPRPIPDVFSGSEHGSIFWKQYGTEPTITLSDNLHDCDGTALDYLRKNNLKFAEIANQLETATKSIDVLLSKYSTLSPALKEFPALWDLLPEDTKDKHREVVEKKPKRKSLDEAQEESVDLSGIGAAIIANKLGA